VCAIGAGAIIVVLDGLAMGRRALGAAIGEHDETAGYPEVALSKNAVVPCRKSAMRLGAPRSAGSGKHHRRCGRWCGRLRVRRPSASSADGS
jgi:hypothetical protein